MESMQEKQSKTSLYTSISATESSILLESGLAGRRTLSDGQFPVLTNLSDTFDARWIGDNGTALADVMIQDLIVPMENSVALPISEGSEERAGADITQSFTSILLSKLGDSAEDFSALIGIPFFCLPYLFKGVGASGWGKVTSKNLKGGKDTRMDVLVMENLLFRRNITRLYDLKGSSRSRYNPDSSGNNKVLLDQNLIEAMPTSPIFVGNKAKRLLERAVWNDTSFLAVSKRISLFNLMSNVPLAN
ncbi:hypothetical protein GW17_00004068 [Ensete ventricosum]|nr:hypothetical protein GW17_00004068 [Ensete ventricosum]